MRRMLSSQFRKEEGRIMEEILNGLEMKKKRSQMNIERLYKIKIILWKKWKFNIKFKI